MSRYDSIHLGSVIDDAITTVINGEAGIQGVKVNDVELTPDEDNKVDVTVPVLQQSTGSSTTDGMTQAAITTALGNKIDTSSIVQASGTSTTDLMSQKAVTDELDTKVDIEAGKGLSTNDYTTAEKSKLADIEAEANKTTIVQTTGTSTTSVMSQKAVTDAMSGGVVTEMGTWEPELVKSASYLSLPTYTFVVREAKYYRVGKACYVSLRLKINVTAVPAAVSGIVIDGLPYTSDSDLSYQSLPIGHVIYADPNPGGYGSISNDSTKICIYKPNSLAYVSYRVEPEIQIIYSGFYIINSSYY